MSLLPLLGLGVFVVGAVALSVFFPFPLLPLTVLVGGWFRILVRPRLLVDVGSFLVLVGMLLLLHLGFGFLWGYLLAFWLPPVVILA